MSLNGIVSVVLFGSYAKGTYGSDSDIDIAVFVCDDKSGEQADIYRKAVRLVSFYPLDIQILMFNEGALADPVGIIEEVVEFGIDISELYGSE